MNTIFRPRGYFEVPDGTEVSPFLNATDVMQQDVPWGSLAEMSVAAGRVKPRVSSWIHIHPVVTQITYLISGQLTIWMKDPDSASRYQLRLASGDAVLTRPGTLFQLVNESDDTANVLYIVSPTYVFEMRDGKVTHDDATMVAKGWDELEKANYDVPALRGGGSDAAAARLKAIERLKLRKKKD